MKASQKNPQVHHFSHRHPLELSHLHHEEKKAAVCSGCQHHISGRAYFCTKAECPFLLHDLCFDLPRRLRHRSHPEHPLILRHSPPYAGGEFTCNACGDSGQAFTYHCGTCGFDLHVECASLPGFEIRRDHAHPLVLVWDFPVNGRDCQCYVCGDVLESGRWVYSCLACGCGAHLECASH
ncbi:cysteine/Histidine-rich C1 domain family protein [Striga asiatica]|uniref:Cysteine/Histidine-rich C1 domain family protein n=1 Tax=Striga asiatica TaxID=4170 RepID=A0A5A7QWH2_STRAF|nr:cysteine/Histidine-rich C1 domain family protein [Striga asiatica]